MGQTLNGALDHHKTPASLHIDADFFNDAYEGAVGNALMHYGTSTGELNDDYLNGIGGSSE